MANPRIFPNYSAEQLANLPAGRLFLFVGHNDSVSPWLVVQEPSEDDEEDEVSYLMLSEEFALKSEGKKATVYAVNNKWRFALVPSAPTKTQYGSQNLNPGAIAIARNGCFLGSSAGQVVPVQINIETCCVESIQDPDPYLVADSWKIEVFDPDSAQWVEIYRHGEEQE